MPSPRTQQVVFDCIAQGVTAPSLIARKTGLSHQQVLNAIYQLHAKGRVVKEAGRVVAYHKCALAEAWR